MAEAQTTVLGPECSFKGDLIISGPCRLLGSFEGSIRGQGELHIAQGAACNATIEVENIVIDGSAKGEVIARQRLQLGAKACVQGEVTAGALSVTEGATLIGRVAVGAEAVNTAQRKTGAATELKPGTSRPARTPEWAEGESPVSSQEWLGQPVKTPGWVKGSNGSD